MRATRIRPVHGGWLLQERVWWGWRRVVTDERPQRLRDLVQIANHARLRDGRPMRWRMPPWGAPSPLTWRLPR